MVLATGQYSSTFVFTNTSIDFSAPEFDIVFGRLPPLTQSSSQFSGPDQEEETVAAAITHVDQATNNNDGDSFSACLLIMDDNHRLSEWIAYHYFAMPLRYLIVAVDPHSLTSPSHILNRWRSKMTIVQWTDGNFTTENLIINTTDDMTERKNKHRTRQRTFYRECTIHMQTHNRTWTSYHDVDEYLAINADQVSNARTLFQRPGSLIDMVKRYSNPTTNNSNPTNTTTIVTNDNNNTKLYNWNDTTITSKTAEPGYWFTHFQQSCCITLPRVLYGAVESTNDEMGEQDMPSILRIDARQFDTLRWRYRTTSPRGMSDGLAKSIMDVSKLRPQDYTGGSDIHKAMKSICPHTWLKYDYPLGFHHYLGSWEQYSYREDARKGQIRTHESWKARSLLMGGGYDDEICGWVQGFVQQVGDDVAISLLKDVGLPLNYTISDEETALWN